tara:strand:- start:9097 stop:10032 length:936 start_codon:yes stop_codon:yes gene_type:complete
MKTIAILKSSLRVSLGLFRVILLVVATLSLVLWISLRSASARVDDSMLELGRHLMGLSEAGFAEYERGTYINGQHLGFRAFTVEHDVGEVLNYYEGWCTNGQGDFARQEESMEVMSESLSSITLDHDTSWRDLTKRGYEDGEGYVACIKHGTPNASNDELGSRLMGFFGSGNLRDLGQFHYAMATRVDDVTRVVAVWTEGDFFPASMFPAEGDASGFDAAGVSRPPTGKRLLSAGEIGHSQTLTIYAESEESLDTLTLFYRRDLLSRGWRVLMDSKEGDGHFFVVQRGSDMRVISLSPQAEGMSVTIATTD